MPFYAALFTLTTLSCFISDRVKGALKVLFTVLTLFLPCFFAGCRDRTVGTDMSVYGYWNFQWANLHTFKETFENMMADGQPIGYTLVTSIDGSILHSLPLHLFIMQALVIVPYYFVARYFCAENTWMAMFWYLNLCYPFSLNILKQSVAVSLFAVSLIFVAKKENWKVLIWVLLAYCFHQTVIVACLLLPLCYMLIHGKQWENGISYDSISINFDKKRDFTRRVLVIAVVSIVFIVIIALGDKILNLTTSWKKSYEFSLEHAQDGGFSTIWFIFLLVIIIIGYLFYSGSIDYFDRHVQGTKNNAFNYFAFNTMMRVDFTLFVLMFIGVLLEQSTMITTNFYRFAYYGLIVGGIYFGRKSTEHHFWSREYNKLFWISIIILIILIGYLFYQLTVLHGGDGVVPYSSELLGIY